MSTAATPSPQVISGLEGVLALESSIAFIDGPNGTLLYRGYNIRDFVEQASFLAGAYLLWHGRWPAAEELAVFDRATRERRRIPAEVRQLIRLSPRTAHPTAILRTAVSMLGAMDRAADSTDPSDVWEKATSLVAQMPTLVAAIARHRQNLQPVEPDPALEHSANLLFMLRGAKAAADEAAALNALLTTYAEHELNASTFAARTTVGTLSDYYSALVLYHLGFPLEEYTNVIISSRIAGWTAHIQEQYANNRLIRPRPLYRGPVDLIFAPAD